MTKLKMLMLAIAGMAVAGASTANAEKVTVAVLRGVPASPIFIADAKGYFKESGIELNLIYVDAATAAPVAVVSGDADFAVIGMTAGFFNLAGKGALKIVGTSVREQKGYKLSGYIASNAAYEAGVRKPEDFKGRAIAITTVGSTYHYNLGQLAQKSNFDLASIRMVPMQSQSNQASAVAGGNTDGAVITAYILSKMEAEKKGRIIGWVSDISPYQTSVAITSTKNAATRRPMIEAFLKAYHAGIKDYHAAFLTLDSAGAPQKGPGYDELLKIVSRYTQQPAEQLEGFFPYIDPEGRVEVQSIRDQVAWWASQNQIDKGINPDSFIDMSYVRATP